MKTIYLHIGKHKTGTTSIQHYIHENEQFFLKRDCYIVKESDFNSEFLAKRVNVRNLNGAAHLILRQELETPMRLQGTVKSKRLSILLEEMNNVNTVLKSIKSTNLIISAEAFSFIRTPFEMELLYFMLRGFKVIPIIFLRDKTLWLKSWYVQVLGLRKQLNLLDDNELAKGGIFDFSTDSWLVDDKSILSMYGNDTVVHSYEDCLAESGSVIPAFLKTIGLPLNECPTWKNIWKNNSKDKPQTLTPNFSTALPF